MFCRSDTWGSWGSGRLHRQPKATQQGEAERGFEPPALLACCLQEIVFKETQGLFAPGRAVGQGVMLQYGGQRIKGGLGPSPRNIWPTLSCPNQWANENNTIGRHQPRRPLGHSLSMAPGTSQAQDLAAESSGLQDTKREGRQGQASLPCS